MHGGDDGDYDDGDGGDYDDDDDGDGDADGGDDSDDGNDDGDGESMMFLHLNQSPHSLHQLLPSLNNILLGYSYIGHMDIYRLYMIYVGYLLP